ncbi:MAG: response regulator transcription factor [Beijerinckiaceae bacterium]
MPRLLLVNSSSLSRLELAERLRARRIRVTEADSLDAAIELIETIGPDAILTERELRDGDCSNLLRLYATRLPVAVIVRDADPQTRCWALALGADEALDWPIDQHELFLRLMKSIRRRQGQDGLFLRAGGLRLDPATRGAVGAGMEGARLTGAEFEALRLLAANSGRIVARPLIHLAAAGRPMPARSRAVDLLISKIRRKLQAMAAAAALSEAPRILAARGGYCLQRFDETASRRALAAAAPATGENRGNRRSGRVG